MSSSRFLALLLLLTTACSGGADDSSGGASSGNGSGVGATSPGYAAYQKYAAASGSGDLATAQRELEAAIRADPKQVTYYAEMGGLLGRQGKLMEAKRWLEKGLQECGEDAALIYNTGLVAYSLEDYQHAEQALRFAAELNPEGSLIWQQLGLTYWRMASAGGGVHTVDRALAERALEAFDRVVALQPATVEARYWAGLVHRELDQDEQAMQFLEQALAFNPRDVRALLAAAEVAGDLGRTDQARQFVDAALGLEPDRARAHYVLGREEARNGQTEKARDAFQVAVEKDPLYVSAWFELAAALDELGQSDEAEAARAEYQRINAEAAAEHYDLGVLAESREDFPRAIRHYHDCVATHPEHVDAHLRVGLLLKNQGALSDAYDHLKRASELDPDNTQTRDHLSEVVEVLRAGTGSADDGDAQE